MTKMKRALALGLVLVLTVCLFAACKKSSQPDGIPGTYTFQKATKEAVIDKKTKETAELDVTAEDTGLKLNLELKEDGTVKITVNGKTNKGTWTADGDTVTVKGTDSEGKEVTYVFRYEDNKLYMEDTKNKVTIVLSK